MMTATEENAILRMAIEIIERRLLIPVRVEPPRVVEVPRRAEQLPLVSREVDRPAVPAAKYAVGERVRTRKRGAGQKAGIVVQVSDDGTVEVHWDGYRVPRLVRATEIARSPVMVDRGAPKVGDRVRKMPGARYGYVQEVAGDVATVLFDGGGVRGEVVSMEDLWVARVTRRTNPRTGVPESRFTGG